MATEPQGRDDLEPTALPLRTFVLGAVSLLAVLMMSLVGLWLVFVPSTRGRFQTPSQAPTGGPQLQADPSIERDRVLDQQRKRLAGYRWIDRDKGLFSIPIDRAMAIIAARGANAYAPIAQQPGGKP